LITERDLLSAIAECQGERNPNANTCIKLAAYYTILDNIRPPKEGAEQPPAYSFAPPPQTDPAQYIEFDRESEFARAVDGKDLYPVLEAIDELMEALQLTNSRLYAGAIRKLREI